MRHGSLFSGIGGFDLAAEWMGWENVFHCEWMEFPRKVLEYHFPNADSLIDICKTDFKKYANKIDILTGGFPCQPFSMAGKRKGTDDERYLWGEMLRAVQEIKPKYVIAENVFGITNIDGGMVFEKVCLDLETEGYEVQPFIIPACAKNAPHRRDRVWFVAYSNFGTKRPSRKSGSIKSNGSKGYLFTQQRRKPAQFDIGRYEFLRDATYTLPIRLQQCQDGAEMGRGQKEICGEGSQFTNGFKTNGKISNATDTLHERLQGGQEVDEWQKHNIKGGGNGINIRTISKNNQWNAKQFFQNFPTQSPLCSGDDGLPTKLDGITFSKWRAESIKGYGNAIVPQVAYEIFKQLEFTK
jgi:DNA (cytosine-5)-methyltransferase 1